MRASAGPIAFRVIGASLQSRSLQEKLGLLMSGAQRMLVTDYKKRPGDKTKDANLKMNESFGGM